MSAMDRVLGQLLDTLKNSSLLLSVAGGAKVLFDGSTNTTTIYGSLWFFVAALYSAAMQGIYQGDNK